MSQENVEIVRRLAEAWNTDDLDDFLAELDPEVEWHPPLSRPGWRRVGRIQPPAVGAGCDPIAGGMTVDPTVHESWLADPDRSTRLVPVGSDEQRELRCTIRPRGHRQGNEIVGRETPMKHCRNPLHCILPPSILESIAVNGDEEQRAWAVGALGRDQSIRLARVENAKVRGDGPREGADALAVRGAVKPNRVIRDAAGTENVNGEVVRRERQKVTGDKAVDEAYKGLGDTFAFFNDVFGRNSIDDAGMPLRGVVHFGERYANAFWDGRRMVFGDGDGQIFRRMTRSLDVIGHELGHGVTEDEAGLEYFGQSGALNESMSDVFGSLVEQHKQGQTAAEASWLIGNEVWTPAIKGDALRSMKAPGEAYDDPLVGKDPQPAHMKKYVETNQDNGGVHINSGIPNHAFYTVATTLGGRSWEGAGPIWFEALRSPALGTRSSFQRFAEITVRVAQQLHGSASAEAKAVFGGWEKVGVPAPKP